ncbi:MAG: glycosyltransferase family 2 protein [Clostridia bacterium]|nr:glycosyltransferase family 2 protein [Clostridia bacterium]
MDFSVGISVIMATYNTEIPMLREAVDSILEQTFHDFEFLIIDDGSTNSSDEYLKSIQDERVKVIWNPRNMGVTKSLNVGLKQAKGKYIARMDADDIALPTRFEKEFAYMEAHPDAVVCGTRTIIMKAGKKVQPKGTTKPEEMEDYRVRMLFMNPGPIHPTAMIRHETLLAHQILYDERLIHAQDYGMWEALSHHGKIYNLDEALLCRRMHEKQITAARRDVQIQCDKMTQKKILTALLGDVTDAEVDLHYTHSTGYYPDAVITPEVAAWYERLMQANKSRRIYDQKKLENRIVFIKKKLIRQSFRPNMSGYEKLHMMLQYLPFLQAVKMFLSLCREGMKKQ